ncbi:hypothetical protein HMPREF1634_05835, partial [Tissierellia bacterium S7-1-4]
MKKRNERRLAIVLAMMMTFMSFIIAPAMAAPGNVAINADNFPDAKFMEYVKKFDTSGDGYLSQDELDAVTEIDVESKEITNLQGIKYFTKLKKLNCKINKLKELDVKSNKELTEICCDHNELTTLDLTNKTKLEYLSCVDNELTALDLMNNKNLEFLDCGRNKLEALDLTKNTKLRYIACSYNKLTTLDLSENKNLGTLYCNHNGLITLDLSENKNLTYINCNDNQLAVLDLTNNTAVTRLEGSGQKRDIEVDRSTLSFDLKSLHGDFDSSRAKSWVGGDVTDDTLKLKNNTITAVTYEYNVKPSLSTLRVKLNVTYGDVVTVSFDKNGGEGSMKSEVISQGSNYTLPACTFTPPAGKEFDKWEVNGTKYDAGAEITVNSDITVKAIWKGLLEINKTNFPDDKFRDYVKTEFDTSGDGYLSQDELDAVTEINVESKKITNLQGIKYFTKLKKLNCKFNKLTGLDVKSNTELTELECLDNQLKTLDLSNNAKLTTINCAVNKLNALDLKNNKNLKSLFCGGNQLTDLDLSKNTELTYIHCGGNQLKTLNSSKNINLKTLHCGQNQLTDLDLKNNTNLETLYCNNNHLTTLNLSENKNLKVLYCEQNQLTNLDLSHNSKVNTFDGSDQKYDIKVSGSTLKFDLESLPGKFDSSMASDWVGGKVTGNTLTLNNDKPTTVTYEYNTGHGNLNVTLNVKYSTEEFTVTFDKNGGSGEMADVIKKKGESYKLPACGFTAPAGKEFKAWEVGGAQKAVGDSITVNANTTVKAIWKDKTSETYTVTFDENGGSGSMADVKVNKNSEYNLPTCTFTPPTGKKFDIWEVNGTKYYEGAGIRVNSNITVKAIWKIIINETNFPDPNFREYVKTFDTSHDNALSQYELVAVREINVKEKKIANLKGIEHFIGLEVLDCSKNPLTALELSKNTELISINCIGNQLTTLNLSKNKNLKNLYCSENQLTTLDLSENINLKILYCGGNQLTALNLSKNTELTYISCNGNQLTTLDLSENENLETLHCDKTQLTALDLTNNTKLGYLSCNENQLTKLDLGQNINLKTLYCNENQLTTLDLSKNTKLTGINCTHNHLKTLDLSNNINLDTLHCEYNQLETLDLSKNINLEYLLCYSNQLTNLDLSNTKVNTFTGSDQVYNIKVSDSTLKFDLRSLPGNFVSSNASGWVGGAVDTADSNILKLNNDPKPTEVRYKYNVNNGDKHIYVTLNVDYGNVVTVSFDNNGGEGTMNSKVLDQGSTYNLPACTFTPPTGKEFDKWEVNEVKKAVGETITVNEDTILK